MICDLLTNQQWCMGYKSPQMIDHQMNGSPQASNIKTGAWYDVPALSIRGRDLQNHPASGIDLYLRANLLTPASAKCPMTACLVKLTICVQTSSYSFIFLHKLQMSGLTGKAFMTPGSTVASMLSMNPSFGENQVALPESKLCHTTPFQSFQITNDFPRQPLIQTQWYLQMSSAQNTMSFDAPSTSATITFQASSQQPLNLLESSVANSIAPLPLSIKSSMSMRTLGRFGAELLPTSPQKPPWPQPDACQS